jgi:ribosomal RNA assembly protein
MKYVQVPDDRLSSIKQNKEMLEERTGCAINLNQRTKTVNIEHKDSIREIQAKDVLEAISVGFNSDTALKLLKSNMYIQKVNISSITRNKKEFKRQKGRVIGENGKTKSKIQELMNVDISIYRDYVSVIGELEKSQTAKEAIGRLVRGEPHSSVYRFLEQKHNIFKRPNFAIR